MDFEAAAKLVGPQLLTVNAETREDRLKLGYGALVTALDIARNHGVRVAVTGAKVCLVLGLLPDMVDWTAAFWTIVVGRRELQALDSLHATATVDFERAKHDLDRALELRRELERRKEALR